MKLYPSVTDRQHINSLQKLFFRIISLISLSILFSTYIFAETLNDEYSQSSINTNVEQDNFSTEGQVNDTIDKTPVASPLNAESNNTLLNVKFVESGTELEIFANATCKINQQMASSNNELEQIWQKVVKHPNINKLNGLVILEEIKTQIRKTRIVIEIDENANTDLTINWQNHSQQISLLSVDSLSQTYPNAMMLGDFMMLVAELRKAVSVCVPIM